MIWEEDLGDDLGDDLEARDGVLLFALCHASGFEGGTAGMTHETNPMLPLVEASGLASPLAPLCVFRSVRYA